MASLLTYSQRTGAAAKISDAFDTFCCRVVVHKEPIKTIQSPESSEGTFGYGDSQSPLNYTYSPVSGVFSGVFSRPSEARSDVERVSNLQFGGEKTRIRFRLDGFAFVNSGITKKLTINDQDWKIVGAVKHKKFLDDIYYVYDIDLVQ